MMGHADLILLVMASTSEGLPLCICVCLCVKSKGVNQMIAVLRFANVSASLWIMVPRIEHVKPIFFVV